VSIRVHSWLKKAVAAGHGNWLKPAGQAGHHRAIASRAIVLLLFGLSAALGLGAAPDDLARLRAQFAAAEKAEDNPAMIELGRRIVALAPNDNQKWESIARTQLALKDYDRTEATLEAWQKAVKQPPAALEDLRGEVAFGRKKWSEAEKHFLAYLARNPSREDAAAEYDNLGAICVEQSRWVDNDCDEGFGGAPRPARDVAAAVAAMGRGLRRDSEGEQDGPDRQPGEGLAPAV
jgi:tetratricopeptide (TPR) repeat protein